MNVRVIDVRGETYIAKDSIVKLLQDFALQTANNNPKLSRVIAAIASDIERDVR